MNKIGIIVAMEEEQEEILKIMSNIEEKDIYEVTVKTGQIGKKKVVVAKCGVGKVNAARVVGVDLPQNKRGEIALTYVYGIGRSSSAKILDKAGVDRDLKVKDWTDDQAAKIREIIGAEYKVEGDLRSEVQLNIKRLMDIGCYRGVRHRIGLPVRGQSTKNNARTRKGRKKTVANKKKATK